MEFTHKLIGYTDKAENCLDDDDFFQLEDMIMSEITISDAQFGGEEGLFFTMPNGKIYHESYLEVEPIKSDSEKLKILSDLMIDHCNNKYFDLVWYARSKPGRAEDARKRIEALYPKEVKDLGIDDNWSHGFNSGMLAASRLYLTVIGDGLEAGLEEFPFLDS